MTKIEWADKTWNCLVGCSKVPRLGKGKSPCAHCYAMGDAPHRFPAVYERDGVVKLGTNPKRPGLTFVPRDAGGKSLGKGAQWTGEVRLLPWKLDEPLRRKKPTKYFVNSLADLFHEKLVGCEEGRRFIAAIFGVMAACPQHTFQILTKRDPRPWFEWLDKVTLGHPRLLFQYLDDLAWEIPDIVIPQLQGCVDRRVSWPLPNVWVGQSVEDQAAADKRIPWLLGTPAAVRWLSVEPMLGPITFAPLVSGDGLYTHTDPLTGAGIGWDVEKAIPTRRDIEQGEVYVYGRRGEFVSIDWIVAGGESGPGARPMHPDWARSLRDQCVEAGAAYHFKQKGAWTSVTSDDPTWTHMLAPDGRTFARGEDIPLDVMTNMSAVAFMKRVGKKAAGRMLDGRTWDEFPDLG